MNMNQTATILTRIQPVVSSLPSHQVIFDEESIEIHTDHLPYIFIIKCFQHIGWHVFKMPRSGELTNDKLSSNLYTELERITDEINLIHFGYLQNDSVDNTLSLLVSAVKDVLDRNSEHVFSHVSKEPGMIRFFTPNNASACIDTGYSRLLDQWYLDAPPDLHDSFRDVYVLINEWNDPIAKIKPTSIHSF